MKRRWSFYFGLMVMIGLTFISVNAYDIENIVYTDNYCVVSESNSSECIFSSDSYEKAANYFDNYNDGSYLIVKNGKVIRANNAVALLDQTDCLTNVEYSVDDSQDKGYTNGCYGVDSAYIKTNSTATYALIRLSGVNVWVPINQVSIVPLSLYTGNFSQYSVENGMLVHAINADQTNYTVRSHYYLDDAPSFLTEDTAYFSYDGHYFYTDIVQCLADIKSGSVSNSVNADSPYYNFYQYNNHLTKSQVSGSELDRLIHGFGSDKALTSYHDLNGDSSNDDLLSSLLVGRGNDFSNGEDLYHVNALMMLSLSLNESGYGRSYLAFTRNNLFGHAAFDNAVEANASKYLSPYSSIVSHAKNYIVDSYCNYDSFTYHGCYFGNKNSGMNVSYASDPYWGEKAASYYYHLDKQLNYSEKSHHSFLMTTHDTMVYKESSFTKPLAQYKGNEHTFVLLETLDDGYVVALDHAIEIDGLVYTKGYIHANDVAFIHQSSNALNEEASITIDANGGSYANGEARLTYLSCNEPTLVPSLDGHQFVEYTLDESGMYIAQYKPTDSLKIVTLPKTEYELNEPLDTRNGSLELTYQDGKKEIVPLTSDMVRFFNSKEAGCQSVEVYYGGQHATYLINVSKHKDELYQSIKETLLATIDYGSVTDQQLLDFKALMDNSYTLFPRFTISQYVALSQLFDPVLGLNDYNVALSGSDLLSVGNLGLALNLNQYRHTALFDDYFSINLKPIQSKMDADHSFSRLNYEVVSSYDLSIKHNLQSIDLLQAPILYQVKLDNFDNTSYLVYCDDGQSLVQLPTHYNETELSFVCDRVGKIYIVDTHKSALVSSNRYGGYFTKENYSKDAFNVTTMVFHSLIALITIAIVLFWYGLVIVMIGKGKKRARNKSNRFKSSV